MIKIIFLFKISFASATGQFSLFRIHRCISLYKMHLAETQFFKLKNRHYDLPGCIIFF